MSEQTIASVSVMDRGTFDNTSDEQKQGNIYFVREGTSETNTMLSLYYENSKQCDILDISAFFVSPESIPDKYKISGKILLAKNEQGTFYQGFMWDGTKFINCLGTVNNVIVCNGLPSIFDAVKNFVYIDISSNGIFVFDGYNYQDIISSNTYATNQYLNQLYYELVDMINNIQPSGSNMIGSAVPVLHGTALTRIGSWDYPLLQGTLETPINGMIGGLAGDAISWDLTPESSYYSIRALIPNLYRIPAGKTATVSVSGNDIGIFGIYCTKDQIITERIGAVQASPAVFSNTSEDDIYFVPRFCIASDDSAQITPSDVGAVTAVLS